MRIEIIGRDYSVAERLNEVVTRKLSKFDKFFDDKALAKVICRKESGDRLTMEVTITFGGRMVRSEYTSDNMYDNVDVIIPKIERQIEKHRAKLAKKLRPDAFAQYDEPEEIIADVKARKPVREKNFELIPMDVDEATLQLELLDHDFFVFLNADNGKVNVVYKRGDGNVGLINPNY
ncbi:MAG: ribosome-associated translation inhibitor RaiA [Clostridia bacterium]|nr:ribosome-associated translation inhibitor RaiA [Clostridia bacterium]